MEFELYTMRLALSSQMSFLTEGNTPPEIIESCIRSTPSYDFRTVTWHIGNIEEIEGNIKGIGFVFGKDVKSKKRIYDDITKNFIPKEDFESKCTTIVCDIEKEWIAIQINSAVAPKTKSIVNMLSKVLNERFKMNPLIKSFHIEPIPDDREFIEQLSTSYSIKKFNTSVCRPNHIDSHKLIQEPLEKIVKEVDGDRIDVNLIGDSLDSAVLTQAASVLSASGYQSKAQVQVSQSSKPKWIKSRGNVIKLSTNITEYSEMIMQILLKMREMFNAKMRGDL